MTVAKPVSADSNGGSFLLTEILLPQRSNTGDNFSELITGLTPGTLIISGPLRLTRQGPYHGVISLYNTLVFWWLYTG